MKFFNLRFALLGGLVIVAAAAGAVILPDTARTQENIAAPAGGVAWANRCEPLKDGDKQTGTYCEAFQRLSVVQQDGDAKNAQRLAEFAVGFPPAEKGKARGAIILPLGVVVDEDVKAEIDGKDSMKFRIRYCDAGGCIAMLDLNAGLLDKMRKGEVMKIKTAAFNGQPLHIALSLKGFAEALDKAKPKA